MISVSKAVGERRRRLLSLLEAAQGLQLVVAAVFISLTEPAGSTRVPLVLCGAAVLVCTSYLLSVRSTRASTMLFLAANSAITPVIVCLDGTGGMTSPFAYIAFTVPTILLANALGSTRWSIVAGIVGVGTTAAALFLTHANAWPDVRHGIIFVLTTLVLVVAFGIHRDREEADRSKELRVRNGELESLRDSLEQRVRQRTRAVTLRSREMQLVLDNVAEGLFTVNRAGAFVSEPSAMLTRIFGVPDRDTLFFAYLGDGGTTFTRSARLAWAQVSAGVLPLEVALAQVPTQLARDGRMYELAVRPVENDNDKFLVVVSDVTVERRNAVRLRVQSETLGLLRRLFADRSAFDSFIAEAGVTVERIVAIDAEPSARLRDVHTLKGNALLVGLESVAEVCRGLEETLSEGEAVKPEALLALRATWHAILSEVEQIAGRRRETIELSRSEHRALLAEAAQQGVTAPLYRRIEELALEPIGASLDRLRGEAERLAGTLDKPLRVTVLDDGVRWTGGDPAPLWAALIHAVRNAVDHGIETAAERVAAGKDEVGHVWLRAARRADALVVEVGDDGAGIDWNAVRRRAEAKGLSIASDADLERAVFEDGVSTAPTPSDISGRGVGMGALRATVQALGGEVKIHSVKGEGTLVELRFVRAPSASAPPGRAVVPMG